MKPNDLTLLEGIVVTLHTISAMAYMVLAHAIFKRKKYLRWNKHIYPVTMYGAFLLSVSLFWLLSTYYFFAIDTELAVNMSLIFVGLLAICYSVASETVRLAYKYDKIEAMEKENENLKGVIASLRRALKNTALFLIPILFFGCNNVQKELQRVTEEQKAKIEMYEKLITEKDEKIKEVEQRQTATATELTQKTTELASLKKERDELKESLDKAERSDVVINNPKGPVKVTDKNGNSYEFEGGEGTTISNKTESLLKNTIERISEKYSEATERAKSLSSMLTNKENTLKQKEAELKEATEREKTLNAKIKEAAEEVQKERTKTATPFYIWMAIGALIPIALYVFWGAIRKKLLL